MALVRARHRPLHRQIYDQLRDAMANGQLRPGERLPSARDLAAQLGLARGTVDVAYAALSGEGFIHGRGAAGSFVAAHLPLAAAAPLAGVEWIAAPARPDGAPGMEASLPFRICVPAFDAFPRKLWARLTARCARSMGLRGLVYPDPAGWPALRQSIAAYLAVSRGVVCRPEQVIVTGGYQAGLRLIATALLRPGDSVWFEDPGYDLARRALQNAGAVIVPIPVDRDGLIVEAAVGRDPAARLAVVTPSHQAPLGVSLSLPRRVALLDWASRTGAWIVEDDYDSEFRYVGRPLAALKSLDRDHRVIYAGTFSKVLYPGLRLGYLVVPESQVRRFEDSCLVLTLGLPLLEQAVTALAMEQGHFARHLKRMRGLYAARRGALAQALLQTFGASIDLALEGGGMQLLARFRSGTADVDLALQARRHGLWPTALSAQAIEHKDGQGLLIGFTNCPEETARQAAGALKAAIGGLV